MARNRCFAQTIHRTRGGFKFHVGIEQADTFKNYTMKKYPFLLATLAMLALVLSLFVLGALSGLQALGFILIFQIAMFALCPRRAVVFTSGMTPNQIEEFQQIISDIKVGWTDVKTLLREFPDIKSNLNRLRKSLGAGVGNSGVRWIGNQPFVTDDCANALTASFVLGVNALGKDAMASLKADESARKQILDYARGILGIESRTALTPTEIPLPTSFAPQIVELVFAYGQARQFATVFPLGAGTVKLPRLKAGEDDFAYLGAGTAGQSQPVAEKRVTAELVTFTANKFGGLIRIPFELEEDTFIPIGQFLARYIARQLAKGEDKTLFLADGTSTYADQTGIGPYCAANTAYLLQLGAGKTKPSDATLDDFRNLRALVSGAVLANMAANGQTNAAYYLHPSFEPMLRSFNKYPNFVIFTNENGKPMFDGWPVRWIGVSQQNTGAAAPSKYVAFFGDLSYWFLGERGQVRVEVSREVFFASDELAMRALERIDVEAMAVDAMAALQTAAA